MTTKGKVTHRIRIERLGEVQEWVLSDEPFADQRNLRRAYERGFYKRTSDFNQGIKFKVAPAATVETVGDAYAHGYFDALNQEQRGHNG
jgi:hypothetical protein